MPAKALQKMAKKAGVSLKDAERYWDEAKQSAADKGFTEEDENFWRYTMGIVKRRMSLSYIAELALHRIYIDEDPVNVDIKAAAEHIVVSRRPMTMQLDNGLSLELQISDADRIVSAIKKMDEDQISKLMQLMKKSQEKFSEGMTIIKKFSLGQLK